MKRARAREAEANKQSEHEKSKSRSHEQSGAAQPYHPRENERRRPSKRNKTNVQTWCMVKTKDGSVTKNKGVKRMNRRFSWLFDFTINYAPEPLAWPVSEAYSISFKSARPPESFILKFVIQGIRVLAGAENWRTRGNKRRTKSQA